MSELPAGLTEFVAQAGWRNAAIEPIPGDASFRKYFRLRRECTDNPRTAMLMYAPPPEEDPEPFLNVAQWLTQNGLRAPHIYFQDASAGWVLTEDFGNDRMKEWIDDHPEDEETAYCAAIDALIDLHGLSAGPFEPYDMQTYQREAGLFAEWYVPAQSLAADGEGFCAAWENVLQPLIGRQSPTVTVLRDYHAENIMLLDDPKAMAPQGLIDFQDALAGHRAYDLVSLLQDARRDLSPELEQAMLERYAQGIDTGPDFLADYAVLGAQRNTKIVGIFTRLYKRDGKPRYLELIPRVWACLERDLKHPVLAPVAHWFDANIPADLRRRGGGAIT